MAPSLVLLHVEALPHASLTSALKRGGWQFYGWDQAMYLRADIYDAVMQNTELTGNWKTRPNFLPWPRPDQVVEKAKVTVKSLFARFAARVT